MKKLLFVCSKNRLRSPTAEAVFSEYQRLEVDSAGLDRISRGESRINTILWRDVAGVTELTFTRIEVKRNRPKSAIA